MLTICVSPAWLTFLPLARRQLENALFRAVVLADGDELTLTEFPQIASQVEGFEVRVPPVAAQVPSPVIPREVVRVEVRDPNVLRLLDENGDVRRLEEMEAEMIRFAQAHYRSQMSEMARKLGIGRSTLYRKMKDFGLAEDEHEQSLYGAAIGERSNAA